MAISDGPDWHDNDEDILAFQEDYPDVYDFVLKVLDGNCSEETRYSIADEYGVEFVDTVMKIITDKASDEDIEEFCEEWGDDFYLPIKKIIQKKKVGKNITDKLRKDEDEYIRYLRQDVPNVYGFVLQQIEGINDEHAIKKLKEDYGDVFYHDLMKVINGREDDDVIERFKEEYHEDVYIAIKNMLALKPQPAKPEQAFKTPLDNSDFKDQKKMNIPPESVPQQAKFKKGDFIGQKYEIVEILGEGGFGIVYLIYYHDIASKQVLHPFYALKTFKEEYFSDKTIRGRFYKEASLWVNLGKHPYIVRAYWVDDISGRLFIAMEWIAPTEEGGPNSLQAYLKCGQIDLTQSLHWAIQFCYGMEYAYSRGIKAHRDIKPANIMIDQDKNVRISDFGLAGLITPSPFEQNMTSGNFQHTMVGTTSMGTPTHMPPEQFKDAASCDERSDIYSFGIVLYQMASGGNLPFYSDNPAYFVSILKHLHHEAPVPTLASPLYPIIQRCLEKEPKKRYQHFKILRVDLEAILKKCAGEVVRIPGKEELDSSEWNNKGISLMNLKRYEEAIACFDKAIKIDKQNSGAWSNKGNSFVCLGRRKDAMSCYDKALEINPSNARAWVNKGALLASLGQPAATLQCLNRALDIKRLNGDILSGIMGIIALREDILGKSDFKSSEVNAICQRIIDLNYKPYDIDGLYNLGLCYIQIEDIDGALKIFLEAERIDGNDSGVWFELMNIYFKKQNAANTLKYCDKLIEVHKYFDESVKIKSLVLSNTGKIQQAISLLKNVLAENGNLDLLWITLSGLYERSHDFEEALNAAKKCLQILNASKSKDSHKIAYVSKVIDGLSQKQANAGIPEIEQAILNLKAAEIDHNKQKPHADAIKRLIRLYVDNADKQKALYYCDMLIKTTNYITDYGNKALVMSFFGDYAGAVVLLADILKEWPHVDDLWYVLSNIHERQKNYPEALKAALQCRDILLGKKNPDRQNLMEVEQKIQILKRHAK